MPCACAAVLRWPAGRSTASHSRWTKGVPCRCAGKWRGVRWRRRPLINSPSIAARFCGNWAPRSVKPRTSLMMSESRFQCPVSSAYLAKQIRIIWWAAIGFVFAGNMKRAFKCLCHPPHRTKEFFFLLWYRCFGLYLVWDPGQSHEIQNADTSPFLKHLNYPLAKCQPYLFIGSALFFVVGVFCAINENIVLCVGHGKICMPTACSLSIGGLKMATEEIREIFRSLMTWL